MKILIVDKDDERISKLKEYLKDYSNADVFKSGKKAYGFFNADGLERQYSVLFISHYLKDFESKNIVSRIREREIELEIENEKSLLVVVLGAEIQRQDLLDFYDAGANEFLIDTFDQQTVLKKIEKKISSTEKDEKDIGKKLQREISKSDIALPTLPDIYFKFKKLLDKDASFQEIAELLKNDMNIAAKIIKLSNSAFFGGIEKNNTVHEAVSRLGLSEIHQLVTAICSKEIFVTKNKKYKEIVNQLFSFSIEMAFISQIPSEKLLSSKKGYPFAMGLLTNLGRLFMIVVIAEMENKKIKKNEVTQDTLCLTIEKYHAAFATKILKNWEFPNEFISTAVEGVYSHKPSDPPPQKMSSLIKLALYIAAKDNNMGPDYLNVHVEDILEKESFDVSLIEIAQIKEKAQELLSHLQLSK